MLLIASCGNSNKNAEGDSVPQENHEFTNDLIHETSPYLLQHTHNPVDWNAWSDVVFKKASEENKLVILSVGYSTCHWCHVMEEESFEDTEVAKFMNDKFVSIKVDREERPDLDMVYQTALQLVNGTGGWPMSAINVPNGSPVFFGTYYEKEEWNNILVKKLQSLGALLLQQAYPFYEIVVVGNNVEQLMSEIHKTFVVNSIMVGSTVESDLSLFKDRYDVDDTFIYVCQNNTCKLPVKTVSDGFE